MRLLPEAAMETLAAIDHKLGQMTDSGDEMLCCRKAS